MLNCGESKKYCHTVIFAGILEMNATLRSQAKYRGVAVKFLLEVGRLRLAAITSAPPCAAPYRAARETGGCSRVESCVSAASQECLHRVTTDHQQPPPLLGVQDFSGGGRSAEQVELAEAAVVFRRRGKRSQ